MWQVIGCNARGTSGNAGRVQLKSESVVGVPNTSYVTLPPEMDCSTTKTPIAKLVVELSGVTVKVYDDPSSYVPNSDGDTTVPATATMKSEAKPVVLPLLSRTYIVHINKLNARWTGSGWHKRTEAVDGCPYTTMLRSPFVTTSSFASVTNIENAVSFNIGVV